MFIENKLRQVKFWAWYRVVIIYMYSSGIEKNEIPQFCFFVFQLLFSALVFNVTCKHSLQHYFQAFCSPVFPSIFWSLTMSKQLWSSTISKPKLISSVVIEKFGNSFSSVTSKQFVRQRFKQSSFFGVSKQFVFQKLQAILFSNTSINFVLQHFNQF